MNLDEYLEGIEEKRATFRYKMIYYEVSVRMFFRSIILSPRHIKWAYQRVTRGYSDRDAWNGDIFLAGQIAGILEWLVEKGIGVPLSYAITDDGNDSVEEMARRRDADYAKHIAIFKEYADNGGAFDQKWKDEFGGVLDNDLDESLQWLSQHFTELWD